NTVHLLVVDAHSGAQPLPAFSHKTELRLAETLDPDGRVSEATADRLVAFVRECLVVAEDQGVSDLFAFATSALRESPNGDAVIERVRRETGVELEALSGTDEARMTFLAVRRWFGWSSGRLLVVDIGGGSLELASGLDEEPDVALSLPLGAGRLHRDHLQGDPPSDEQVSALRKHIRAELAREIRPILRSETPNRSVGTSKTLRSLARIAGAAPSAEGPFVPRSLSREDASAIARRLRTMTIEERATLPGVSAARAPQLLAGALVAEAVMDLLSIESLEICPWAMREGLILRHLDHLDA
ncbi:MAG: Ppx/GppA phosphatase family protein, partial [Intrasporangium sp.]|uniref:Ppx/GppA phosphatase family protein n=1 Tax=Intrasporangium sp. TaxID=1925024 RepID=UPI003F810EAB